MLSRKMNSWIWLKNIGGEIFVCFGWCRFLVVVTDTDSYS